MKYYSESLKKVFDTEELLNEAEKAEEARIAKEKIEKEKKNEHIEFLKNRMKELTERYADVYKKRQHELDDIVEDYNKAKKEHDSLVGKNKYSWLYDFDNDFEKWFFNLSDD